MQKILHITPAFYPATYWGGPIFSTKAICDGVALNSEFEVRVLTTDTAGPKISDRVHAEKNPRNFEGDYSVYYARRVAANSISPELLSHLVRDIKWADLVHLTGTYSFPTLPTLLVARFLGKPLVWSPRGALQASAEWKGGGRRISKLAFERFARIFAPRKMHLHVTSQVEYVLSLQRMPSFSASVIPNSVNLPEQLVERSLCSNRSIRLLFISRLHKKKGLEFLFSVLSNLPVHFILTVFGTGEPEYVETLKQHVIDLGLSDRVAFRGHVEGADKETAFREADIFVLPSFSENFGIVIAEALGRGLPVIVSQATPWQKVEEYGCGYWIPLDCGEWIKSILRMSEQDTSEIGRRGRRWMIEEYSPAPIASQMTTLYKALIFDQCK